MEKERVRGFGHLGGASPFKTLLGTPRWSLLFLIHKLTLKPLSTVKDYTASLTGKAVREKTLLSFLQKLAIFGSGRELIDLKNYWHRGGCYSPRSITYTPAGQMILRILLKSRWNFQGRKQTTKRHQVKIFMNLLSTFTLFSSFIWCKFYFHNYKLVSSRKYLIILKLRQVPFSLVVVRISDCISL